MDYIIITLAFLFVITQEAKLTKLENGINVVKLESQMLVTHLNSLAPLHAELEKEMSQQRQLLSSREAEISGNVTDIERKQSMINIFNKKIKEIVSSTGVSAQIQAPALTHFLKCTKLFFILQVKNFAVL